MEVDTATSTDASPVNHLVPEVEIYCYLLVLLFLIDQKKYNEVGSILLTELLIFNLAWID